ncbi:YjbQ family protein [Candidatus Woesearchaeota archaeon]|nr:YjbQ family protein [Candidatus Woesearchaeota archaeon]
MLKQISLSTNKKFDLIDITSNIKKIVETSKVKDGLCVVYAPHATGAIIINESADPELKKDILDQLAELVPDHGKYRHDRIDNNAQAHIKTALLGSSESIPIKDGKLQLGTWQAIMFAELDGPRDQRKVLVKII